MKRFRDLERALLYLHQDETDINLLPFLPQISLFKERQHDRPRAARSCPPLPAVPARVDSATMVDGGIRLGGGFLSHLLRKGPVGSHVLVLSRGLQDKIVKSHRKESWNRVSILRLHNFGISDLQTTFLSISSGQVFFYVCHKLCFISIETMPMFC